MFEHFFVSKDNEIITPISVTFDKNGCFNELTGYTLTNKVPRIFKSDSYTYLSNYIEVLGIGKIRCGDLIKLDYTDKYYTLGYGWYTTNEGLDLFGWYLYKDNIVKPFYKSYIDKVEVIKFNYK